VGGAVSPLSQAFALARRRPSLWLAWLAALALPAMLAMLPLDLALTPVLDLRPAADALVRAPTDDALFAELLRTSPGLAGAGVGGLVITLLLGVPALWLLAGLVAAAAIDSPAPARLVAGRALGVALVALPLRALPAMGAAALAWPAMSAQTLAAARSSVAAALAFWIVGAAAVSVLVDFARGAALADVERGLFGVLGDGLAAARRRPRLYFGLVVLELALAGTLLLPIAASRPFGVLDGAALALALATLVLRALGAVVGIAAAAKGAASRSG
jgi:hypothetical protein